MNISIGIYILLIAVAFIGAILTWSSYRNRKLLISKRWRIKVNETNKEAKRERVTVIAKSLNIVPTTPSTNTIGINTATVVKVDAVIAIPTSEAPSIAASSLEYPSEFKRNIFSSTTIALSTSIPTARANPPSVSIFKVIPLKYKSIKDAIKDIGIDSPIIRVVLIFFKNI